MEKSNARKVGVSLDGIFKESCAEESKNIKTRANSFSSFKNPELRKEFRI